MSQRDKLPKIMIITLVKNDAKWIPRFLSNFDVLDYPKELLKIIFIYGISTDNSFELISNFKNSHSAWNIKICEELKNFQNKTGNSAYVSSLLNDIKAELTDEEFVWYIDADIVNFPPETLKKLMEVNKDIVAAWAVYIDRDKTEQLADSYIFRDIYGRCISIWDVSKITKPIELGSVGMCYLVNEKIFRTISFEDPCPNFQFCKNAREAGYRIWALPYLKVYHIDPWKEGKSTNPTIEELVKRGILPKEDLEKMKLNGFQIEERDNEKKREKMIRAYKELSMLHICKNCKIEGIKIEENLYQCPTCKERWLIKWIE